MIQNHPVDLEHGKIPTSELGSIPLGQTVTMLFAILEHRPSRWTWSVGRNSETLQGYKVVCFLVNKPH